MLKKKCAHIKRIPGQAPIVTPNPGCCRMVDVKKVNDSIVFTRNKIYAPEKFKLLASYNMPSCK